MGRTIVHKKGSRTYSNFKIIDYTYKCPDCGNTNSEPLRNDKGKPYCSACMVNRNEKPIMKKHAVRVRKRTKGKRMSG